MGDIHTKVRYAYMDALTRLWRASFSEQLGKWCEAHGVEYIGHIIEDMNAHARMAYSAGHYFRALDGQHMAGIDVVLHQIVPGMAACPHTASIEGGIADPAFFDNVLAKLAASHAHIQPHMKGRAMCEVFGAYGWAEGAPMMKGLLDHMLVRGNFQPKFCAARVFSRLSQSGLPATLWRRGAGSAVFWFYQAHAIMAIK